MLNRTINKDQKDYYFSKAYLVPTGLSNNDNGELTGHFELFIDAIEFKKVSEKEDEVRITMIPERILNPEFTEKNPLIESLEQQVSIFNPMMQMFLSEEEVEKLRTRLVWQNGEPFTWVIGEGGTSTVPRKFYDYDYGNVVEILSWDEERVEHEKHLWERKQVYSKYGL